MQKVSRLMAVAIAFMMAIALISAAAPASAATVTTTPAAPTATVPLMVYVSTTSNVYDSPTTGGNIVGTLFAGQTWFVMGTDSTATWTQVQITPLIYAWAPTSVFSLSGVTLPVIAGFTGGSVAASTTTASTPALTSATTAPAAATVAPAATAAPASAATATVPLLVFVNTTTTVYDAPNTTTSDVIGTLNAGQTWFVMGTDTTGKWTEVQITPVIYAWAPTSTLGVAGANLPVIAGVTGSK